MALCKLTKFRELPSLNLSICWNVSQRNLSKQRTVLKKLGFPEKPKRPVNGYFTYFMENRESIQAKNPNLSFTETSKLMGKNWRELPENEKQKYVDMFKQKLKEYKEQLKEYNESLNDKQKSEMNDIISGMKAVEKEKVLLSASKKLKVDLDRPKKPLTPYLLFCSESFQDFQKGKSSTERVRELAQKWKELSKSEKEKYETSYKKEFEQYKKDLEEWEEKMIQKGNIDLIRVKTLRGRLQKFT